MSLPSITNTLLLPPPPKSIHLTYPDFNKTTSQKKGFIIIILIKIIELVCLSMTMTMMRTVVPVAVAVVEGIHPPEEEEEEESESERYERDHVHRVYDQIAAHFSATRFKVRICTCVCIQV